MSSTIQRKLRSMLTFVVAMWAVMFISSLIGLVEYRNVVRDFDYAVNKAPHRSELQDLVGELFRPLMVAHVNGRNLAGEALDKFVFEEQQKLHVLVRDTLTKFFEFRRRIEGLNAREVISGRKMVTDQVLNQMQVRLIELERLPGKIESFAEWEYLTERRRQLVAHLALDALRMPDPADGMKAEFETAKRVGRTSAFVLIGASIVALVIFALALGWGYKSIFNPLRKLQSAASFVANDNFGYHVDIRSEDEMGDLAEAFNRMSARFREIKTGLHREVETRSRQLVRSERLAGVGFLAAGVAHEINNPLSAIQMAADSLVDRVKEVQQAMPADEASVVLHYLKLIQQESERCHNITARLLDFARGQDSTRSRINLTDLVAEVRDMVQLLSQHRGKEIRFNQERPCYIECNGAEIKQVVLNLVANGLEAMESGGRLTIDLAEQTDQVLLSIRDTGFGMTPEVKENLFEPFFTQKRGGQGTGLGLSITHRIIQEHGGSIEADSAGPGQGSTFVVRLPKKPPQSQGLAA